MIKTVLPGIMLGDSANLKGDLTKSYSALILLSDTVKTETLPEGTKLPYMLRFKFKDIEAWDVDRQNAGVDFLINEVHRARNNKRKDTPDTANNVLIISDTGDSRAPALVVRLLIRLGFKKSDAIGIVREKTGFTPKPEITKNFPVMDENRLQLSLIAIHGKAKAVTISQGIVQWFGISKTEMQKIPEISKVETDRLIEANKIGG